MTAAHLLIAYDSQEGHGEAVAERIAEGARATGAQADGDNAAQDGPR